MHRYLRLEGGELTFADRPQPFLRLLGVRHGLLVLLHEVEEWTDVVVGPEGGGTTRTLARIDPKGCQIAAAAGDDFVVIARTDALGLKDGLRIVPLRDAQAAQARVELAVHSLCEPFYAGALLVGSAGGVAMHALVDDEWSIAAFGARGLERYTGAEPQTILDLAIDEHAVAFVRADADGVEVVRIDRADRHEDRAVVERPRALGLEQGVLHVVDGDRVVAFRAGSLEEIARVPEELTLQSPLVVNPRKDEVFVGLPEMRARCGDDDEFLGAGVARIARDGIAVVHSNGPTGDWDSAEGIRSMLGQFAAGNVPPVALEVRGEWLMLGGGAARLRCDAPPVPRLSLIP